MKLTAVLIALAALPLAAQSQPMPRPHSMLTQEVADYRLTLPQMHKYMDASRTMAKAFQDPAVQAWAKEYRAKHKDAGDFMAQNKTLAETAHYIDANIPPMAKAIHGAGLSTQEYLQITFAYIGAAMADGMMRAYHKTDLPKGVAGENVAFLQKNRAEMEAFQKEWSEAQKHFKGLSGGPGDSDDGSDGK